MLPNLKNRVGASLLQLLFFAMTALALAACGGGGGSPGAVGGSGSSNNAANQPKLVMSITDGVTTTPITTLSGGQKGVVAATLTDGTGKAIAGAIVNFASSSSLITFEPVSASALTDDKGVAVVRVVPSSVTAAGALSITAAATVGTANLTATANIAVGAAPLTVGKLSFSPPPTGVLPAFSTLALNIPVTSGNAPAASVSGLVMTSLCVGDGKATLVAGPLNNGVQSATYTNNGCLRGKDTITVSIGNSSQSIDVLVDPANIGTIQFIGTDLAGQSIVLKGSGGLGRKEAAVVTFRVVDQNNNGLAGVDVTFRATTNTGGLTVQPDKGTTDAAGNVTTTVSSGTIPTPVRVIAEAVRNGKNISGLSDSLIVSTGLPIQRSLSLSADSYNIEGWNYDGEVANITIRMADQFGNPISDNTAVNFVTEGGAIGSAAQGACLTTNGGCSVPLTSQNFRPTNGRVTILAYVQGVENFIDSNGDGQYTCSSWTTPDGKPVTGAFRPLVDICAAGAGEPFTDQGDPFLDTGDHATYLGQPSKKDSLDGNYDPSAGDKPIPYEHASYQSTGNGRWGLNYIFATTEIVFSGSVPQLIRQFVDPSTGAMRDWVFATDGDPAIVTGLSGAGCSNKTLLFRVTDVNNNPLPKGTALGTADVDKVAPLTVSPNLVASTTQIGGTFHGVTIKPEAGCAPGLFSISVTVPKGGIYQFGFRTN